MRAQSPTEQCPHCRRRFKPAGLDAHLAARETNGGLCAPPEADRGGQEWKNRRRATYQQDYRAAMSRLGGRDGWPILEDVEHMT